MQGGIVALVLLAIAGCGRESLEQKLVGQWIGSPDTAAAREKRNPSALTRATLANAAAPEAEAAEEAEADDSEATSKQPANARPTDIEAFAFEVTLNFARGGKVEMWLDNEREKLAGKWLVISEASDRAVIEIINEANNGKPEQRRFELFTEEDDKGFTLREEGADPQFGWLYFRRAAKPTTKPAKAKADAASTKASSSYSGTCVAVVSESP